MTFKQLRAACLALPEVEERETWGEATFRVRSKIFAISSPDGDTASIKASLDDQSGLGRYGWVRVQLRSLSPALAERLIRNAWRQTAPKRLLAKVPDAL